MVSGLNKVVEDEEDESGDTDIKLGSVHGSKKHQRAQSNAFVLAGDYDSELNKQMENKYLDQ